MIVVCGLKDVFMLYWFDGKWLWFEEVELSVASASFQEARAGLTTLKVA